MIHKYKFKDRYIVLDVNSGAVYEVSDVLYELLDTYTEAGVALQGAEAAQDLPESVLEKYGADACREALGEVLELVRQGYLFSEESFTKEQFTAHGPRLVKAMCLHVAHDCNMNCQYCFGGQGAFEGNRSLMSFETGKKAIDYLLAHSGERHHLEIDFFGGEPLMNFEVVRQLTSYGISREKEYNKHIRFTVTTNGLLLDDDKIAFMNAHMDNVILSLDGRPDINDRMRRTWSDGGTHEMVLLRYLNFVKKRQGLYYVRGTFTRENLDFSEDVQYLTGQGFQNVSVEPVVSGPEFDFAIREEDLPRIYEEYDKLTNLYIEKRQKGENFDFFHFNIDLEQGPCVIKRLSGCGAGQEYLAVSPEGDLYPCHQFVGNPVFYMGNLHEIAEKTAKINGSDGYDLPDHGLGRAGIFDKPACMECWAKYYCGGGCHANAYSSTGDIRKPYRLGCEMEKKRVECAIGAKIELAEK